MSELFSMRSWELSVELFSESCKDCINHLKANASYSIRGGPRCETWTVDREGGWGPDGPPGPG